MPLSISVSLTPNQCQTLFTSGLPIVCMLHPFQQSPSQGSSQRSSHISISDTMTFLGMGSKPVNKQSTSSQGRTTTKGVATPILDLAISFLLWLGVGLRGFVYPGQAVPANHSSLGTCDHSTHVGLPPRDLGTAATSINCRFVLFHLWISSAESYDDAGPGC